MAFLNRGLISMQNKWDVNELHRHRDFAPVKREPAQPKRVAEDDDLPPPPTVAPARSSNTSNAIFEGDGEFGSTHESGTARWILKANDLR